MKNYSLLIPSLYPPLINNAKKKKKNPNFPHPTTIPRYNTDITIIQNMAEEVATQQPQAQPQPDQPQNQPNDDGQQQKDKKEKKEGEEEDKDAKPDIKGLFSPKGALYIVLWFVALLQFSLFASTDFYEFEGSFEACLANGVLTWLWCFVGLLLLIITPLLASKIPNGAVVLLMVEMCILSVLCFWNVIAGIVAAARCSGTSTNGGAICHYYNGGNAKAGIAFTFFAIVLQILIILYSLFQVSRANKK